jgi:peptide chain release factor
MDAETTAARRAAVMKESSVHIARGSGPGGQSINKTKNSVMIIHEPTGVAVRPVSCRFLANWSPARAPQAFLIVAVAFPARLAQVRVQDKRSLLQNRKLAEKRLADKVDFHLNGSDSKLGQRIAKYRKAKARSAAKSKAKHSKTQENLDETSEVHTTLK